MTRAIQSIDELRPLVGQEVGVSEWQTISQEQINQFARVTNDPQWIHLDQERASRESPYGTTIAHGFLTLSLLPGMLSETVQMQFPAKMRVNYGLNRLRFTGAVPAGSRVRARFALNSLKDLEGAVELIWNVTVDIEGRDKPALVAEWIGRTYY